MENLKRYFNTSGPNIISEHYTLLREQLVVKGQSLVHGSRYFTIWAPRQTGKSTYFLMLKTALEKEGYAVAHFNAENYLDATKEDMVQIVSEEIHAASGRTFTAKSFTNLERQIKAVKDIKLVLIIDEIEGLNPKVFGQFIHTIRNLYHSRQEHCLKSVILVGVSNIVGIVEDNASPFNIADNLNVPYFTTEETFELLGQHEAETGQLFSPEVKAKIADVTANQPGLVNGFAQQLIERFKDKPVIGMEEYIEVEEWYLRKTIDKNITNILNKARRYRSFVERLLFGESPVLFNINREEIKVLSANGVIGEDEKGNVTFLVPLYRKCLHDAFYPYTNGEREQVSREIIASEFFLPNGQLDFPTLVANYKAYVQRRSFKYFREKDVNGNYFSLKEAALVYSFETYIAAFLHSAGGKSYLEPHIGLGRCDLQLFLRGQEYVVEFKVYGGEIYFNEGKKQLAYYCKKIGLSSGEYLNFVPNHIRLPVKMKEDIEQVEGVTIRSWLVMYDEQKDF